MKEVDANLEISRFIKKRRAKSVTTCKKEEVTDKPVPWYKRPLTSDEFSIKLAKNKRYYARHNEWKYNIWVGPYNNVDDVNTIVKSYVTESLKGSLSKKLYNEGIHSVIIDNPDEFF